MAILNSDYRYFEGYHCRCTAWLWSFIHICSVIREIFANRRSLCWKSLEAIFYKKKLHNLAMPPVYLWNPSQLLPHQNVGTFLKKLQSYSHFCIFLRLLSSGSHRAFRCIQRLISCRCASNIYFHSGSIKIVSNGAGDILVTGTQSAFTIVKKLNGHFSFYLHINSTSFYSTQLLSFKDWL